MPFFFRLGPLSVLFECDSFLSCCQIHAERWSISGLFYRILPVIPPLSLMIPSISTPRPSSVRHESCSDRSSMALDLDWTPRACVLVLRKVLFPSRSTYTSLALSHPPEVLRSGPIVTDVPQRLPLNPSAQVPCVSRIRSFDDAVFVTPQCIALLMILRRLPHPPPYR